MAERWVKWLGQGRREVWELVWPTQGAVLPVDEVRAELLMKMCRGQFDYDDPPELMQVRGIGPQAAVALMAMGIRTLEDLAMADSGVVQDERLTRWAGEARKVLGSRDRGAGNRETGDQGAGE